MTMVSDQMLIPFLVFISIVCLGGSLILRNLSKRALLRKRLGSSAHGGLLEDQTKPSFLARLVARIGAKMGTTSASDALHLHMAKAGFTGPSAVTIFFGAKFVLFATAAGGAVPAVAFLDIGLGPKFILVLLCAMTGFFIPNMVLKARAQARTLEVRQHLPDVVDLLEICVSGGMGLDMAWNAVAEEARPVSPLLADEMALTNLEIHLGEERGEALRHMAERTGATELSSLVAVLVQSERFGTSVSQALRVFAASMRETRSQRAEELAEKMGVKMLFPMILFIFPVVIIVAVGPAVITLIDIFSKQV